MSLKSGLLLGLTILAITFVGFGDQSIQAGQKQYIAALHIPVISAGDSV